MHVPAGERRDFAMLATADRLKTELLAPVTDPEQPWPMSVTASCYCKPLRRRMSWPALDPASPS